jgi:PAS domain-containing protein
LPQETPLAQGPAEQGSGTARMRAIIEALPMAFVVWDSSKRLQLCNRKFRQIYRIGPGKALPGTPFEEYTGIVGIERWRGIEQNLVSSR